MQLIQVPVFFHFWTTAVYGDWLIVSAIPTQLSFSTIGFGNVASSEMTMLVAGGDREGALRVFQSCWWLISIICIAIGLLLVPVLYFVPVASVLPIRAISQPDAKWIIFYLGISVLFAQLEQLMGAAYTCVARYSYGTLVKLAITLAAFTATMVPIVLGYGPRTAAMVYAAANIAGTVTFGFIMRRDLPWIEFGWRHARFSEIRRLARPAFAFMGFPLGIAFSLQGTLIAVGYALGPIDVAIFASARTVSRIALQMVGMVNNTVWPEMSLAFGARNFELLRTLHRRACQSALLIAFLIVVSLMTVGPWFLTHWTRGHVPPSRPLLSILLFVVFIYALWSTSSTLAQAINRHQRLAAWYMVASGITVLFTYAMARRYGLYGAAASLVLSEVIMNFYVLPASLRIAHDTFPAFLASMLQYPQSLRPAALLARIGRSKPTLEAE
jgi:O-antigen/teichoic acid export membrane protein